MRPIEIYNKVNEKLPKQVKYIIRPIHTSLITAIAQFNGNEYEGSGFTQREAKNEAARSLLKEIVIPYPHPPGIRSYINNQREDAHHIYGQGMI